MRAIGIRASAGVPRQVGARSLLASSSLEIAFVRSWNRFPVQGLAQSPLHSAGDRQCGDAVASPRGFHLFALGDVSPDAVFDAFCAPRALAYQGPPSGSA